MRFGIKIGALSIEWERAIHRVFFFANERSLTEKILREVENSLLIYSLQTGIPLVTIGESEPLRFFGRKFTVAEFVDYTGRHRPYEGFALLIKPGVFYQRQVAENANCIWIRTRPLGIPAFAVCDADASPIWKEFASDAFTRFYFFDTNHKLFPELLIHSDTVKSCVIELDRRNMVAVCQARAF